MRYDLTNSHLNVVYLLQTLKNVASVGLVIRNINEGSSKRALMKANSLSVRNRRSNANRSRLGNMMHLCNASAYRSWERFRSIGRYANGRTIGTRTWFPKHNANTMLTSFEIWSW